MNDPIYKRIFAFPRMVEDLLRGFAKGDWIQRADFSALRKAPAEYVGDDLRKRLGDSVWRLPLDGGWLHVLVLLEFQSRNERDMALRILEYTAMLHRELSRSGPWPGRAAPAGPARRAAQRRAALVGGHGRAGFGGADGSVLGPLPALAAVLGG